MDIGMLWYDDDKQRRFDEKVARAVEYYRTKYGVQPTECYVHPGMLAGDAQAVTQVAGDAQAVEQVAGDRPAAKGGNANPAQLAASGAQAGQLVSGVRLRANRTVIKNHFWLGVGEGGATPAASGGAKASPRSPKSSVR